MKKSQNIMKMIVDTWSRNLNTNFTLGDYFFWDCEVNYEC